MEVKSEQQYTDVTVTDIDVAYPGDLRTFTLLDGDTMTNDGVQMVLTFKAGGKVVLNIARANWYAQRERMQRVLAPTPPAE